MNKPRLIVHACFFLLLISTPVMGQESQDQKQMRRERIKQSRLLLKSAVKFINAAEYDSASVMLDSILTLDAKNPDAFYYQANIRLYLRDSAGAVEILTRAIEQAPLSTRLKLLLSRLKLKSGAFQEAANLLDSILAIKSRQGEALYLRGIAHLKLADTSKAIDMLQQAGKVAMAKEEQ